MNKIARISLYSLGIFLLIGILFGMAWVTAPSPDYIIDGNKVYVDDANIYLSAEPHTIHQSQWVTFELISKYYSGDADIIWGFDSDITKPKKAELYNPHYENWTTEHSKTFLNISSFEDSVELCDFGFDYNLNHKLIFYTIIVGQDNETNTTIWDNTQAVVCYDSVESLGNNDYKASWTQKHSKFVEWNDFQKDFQIINHEFQGMDKWYLLKNVNIEKDKDYKLRAYVEVPISLNSLSGKYWVAIKPSSETLQEAIANGHLYYLDPWWNVSYTHRYPIINNQTNTHAISVNDTGGVAGSIIWSLIGNSSYVYSIDSGPSGTIAIANDTAEKYWENETSRTGNTPTSIWDAEAVWHFGENTGTDVHDSSGNGNDGTFENTPDWVSGNFGQALDFNGVDEVVNTTTLGNLGSNLGNGASFSFWIKTTSSAGSAVMGSFNTATAPNKIGIQVEINVGVGDDTGKIRSFMRDKNGLVLDFYTTNDVNFRDGEWHHIVVTSDGPNDAGTIYLDGALQAITYADQQTPIAFQNFIHPFLLGARNTYGVAASFFNGTLDEVRIYNKLLAEDEILQQYYNGVNNLTHLGAEETSNTAPNITLDVPVDTENLTSLSLTFNYVPYDDSGFSNCSLWTNESGWSLKHSNISAIINDFINTLEETFSSDGSYLWNVECYDDGSPALNNFSSSNFTLNIDSTLPVLTIHSPENTTYTTASIDLNWSSSETLDWASYSLNGASNVSLYGEGVYTGSSFDTAGSGSDKPFGITQNGTYFWTTNNQDDKVYKYYMNGTYTGEYFDVSSEIGAPKGMTNDGTYLWVNDYNEVYKYHMNGTYTGDHFDTLASGNGDPRGMTNDGTYFWIVDYTDNEVYKYYMNGTYTGDHFDTGGSGASTPSGITQDGTYFWITDYTDDKVYKYYMESFFNTTITAIEGLNNITVYGNDTAGNMNNTLVYFTSGTTNPAISYNPSTTATGNYSQDWIFVNITCSDTNKDTVIFNWNGTNETFDNSSADVYWENKTSLGEGTYTFYAWCNDSATNSNLTSTRTVILDTTAPTLLINFPINNSKVYSGQLNVLFNINSSTDAGSGISSRYYAVGSGANVSFDGDEIVKHYYESPYTVTFYVNDTAGNLATDSVNYELLVEGGVSGSGGGGGFPLAVIGEVEEEENITIIITGEPEIPIITKMKEEPLYFILGFIGLIALITIVGRRKTIKEIYNKRR